MSPRETLVILSGLGLASVVCATSLVAQLGPPDTSAMRRVDAPILAPQSNCLRQIPSTAGVQVTAYLGVPAGDSIDPLLRAQVDNFAADLGDDVRRALGVTVDSLPDVGAWMNGLGSTSLDLLVRRDGTFDWKFADGSSSSASTRKLLREALKVRRNAGEMIIWPGDLAGDSAHVRLSVEIPILENGKLVGNEVLPVAIALFRTRIYRVKPAAVKRAEVLLYPDSALLNGWTGTIKMRFLVDTLGRAVDSTITDVWPKDKPRLESERAEVYREFVDAARRTIHFSTFYPAEIAGCKANQVVEQSFTFDSDAFH